MKVLFSSAIAMTVAIGMILSAAMPAYALAGGEQTAAIEGCLAEASRQSGTPGMSVSVRMGDQVQYFQAGYGNREEMISANEDTLYQLASVSKAFTAFGILLLEEQGRLSMDDPIQKYLPWFTLRFNGQPVDMEKVTLKDFLYHTSGLTNGKHMEMLPVGAGPEMLRKTVETYVDTELAFPPGERFEYGTMNYDVLAQVTAIVSGQSWEEYMQTQVLSPLGLLDTYMYSQDAAATGRLARGYVISFQQVVPLDDAPVYEGNKPAGYIISTAKDMARWAGIQMGVVEVPEIYRSVIAKAHQGNRAAPVSEDEYYAGGWSVDGAGSWVRHGGNNPNFTTYLALYPEEDIAICLLTNAGHTNTALITQNIKDILDGKAGQGYTGFFIQIGDQAATWGTVIAGLLAAVFLLLGIRRWRGQTLGPLSKRRVVVVIGWGAATVAIIVAALLFPALVGVSWWYLMMIKVYSMLTMFAALVLAVSAAAWFAFARRD